MKRQARQQQVVRLKVFMLHPAQVSRISDAVLQASVDRRHEHFVARQAKPPFISTSENLKYLAT